MPRRLSARWIRRYLVVGIVALQALCAVYLIAGIVLPLLGLRYRPIDWRLSEVLEVGAALGLAFGVGLGAFALHEMQARAREAEERLRLASDAFIEVLERRFEEWRLTPAERDVALFALKGLSTAEIAQLRSTTEGTVKVQTNAIYRKAGVSGRPQLLSLFIEELMNHRPPRPPQSLSA